MKICFSYNTESFYSKLVKFVSGEPTHVELKLDLSEKFKELYPRDYAFFNGLSFSSSSMDNGIRLKDIGYSSSHWEMFELNLLPIQEILIIEEVKKLLKQKMQLVNSYDYYGIFYLACEQTLLLRIFSKKFKKKSEEDLRKMFCSEVVSHLINIGLQDTGNKFNTMITPKRLRDNLFTLHKSGSYVFQLNGKSRIL